VSDAADRIARVERKIARLMRLRAAHEKYSGKPSRIGEYLLEAMKRRLSQLLEHP
jgi:hypothetical protein